MARLLVLTKGSTLPQRRERLHHRQFFVILINAATITVFNFVFHKFLVFTVLKRTSRPASPLTDALPPSKDRWTGRRESPVGSDPATLAQGENRHSA